MNADPAGTTVGASTTDPAGTMGASTTDPPGTMGASTLYYLILLILWVPVFYYLMQESLLHINSYLKSLVDELIDL